MPADHPLQDAVPPGGVAARRVRPIYRVFVSSTWLDLQPERRALMDALNRMEEMRFVGMEFFGNRPDDTHHVSIDQVDLCEVFVGIIGHRYGSGITAAEYRRARSLGLPCFVYFKRGEAASPEQTDNDPALAAKLAEFKQELLRGHTVKEFDRPEELSANATADLPRDLSDVRMFSFQVLRPLVLNTMAWASLQALDGQGDAALATLLPLLQVGGKLEEAARGVRYWRDAREMQDAAIKAAGFVLDNTPVSAEARARFAAALVARGGGTAGARRVYAIRFARIEQASRSFGKVMTSWDWEQFAFLQQGLDLLGSVAFNRQASLNRWGELFADLAEFAQRREFDQAQQRATGFLAQEGGPRFKNVGNSWVIRLTAVSLVSMTSPRNRRGIGWWRTGARRCWRGWGNLEACAALRPWLSPAPAGRAGRTPSGRRRADRRTGRPSGTPCIPARRPPRWRSACGGHPAAR